MQSICSPAVVVKFKFVLLTLIILSSAQGSGWQSATFYHGAPWHQKGLAQYLICCMCPIMWVLYKYCHADWHALTCFDSQRVEATWLVSAHRLFMIVSKASKGKTKLYISLEILIGCNILAWCQNRFIYQLLWCSEARSNLQSASFYDFECH